MIVSYSMENSSPVGAVPFNPADFRSPNSPSKIIRTGSGAPET